MDQTIATTGALNWFLRLLLFFLPWQTIWLAQERFILGAKWEYGTLGFYATEGLLWLVVICFMLWFWQNWRKNTHEPFSWTPDRRFIAALFAFLLYCFASVLRSHDKELALQQSLHIMEAIFLFLVLSICQWSNVRWFIAGAILPSILGIWQFLSQSTFSSALLGLATHPAWQAGTSIVASAEIGRWLRAYGPFAHPNIFGGYLVAALVLLDFLLLQENKKQYHLSSIAYRLSHIALSLIFITAIFFTFSRSAWLAYAIWLVIQSMQNYKLKAKSYQLVIVYRLSLIAILAVIFSPLLLNRLNGESVNESRSTAERVSGYSEAWSIVKENPLLGVGAGNYTAALIQKNPGQPGYAYQPVHSVPLLFLAELGLVGFILLTNALFEFNKLYPIPYTLLPLASIILLDHYLLSSYIGLMLLGAYAGLSPPYPQSIHKENKNG